MESVIIIIGIFGLWLLLQLVILPKLGVDTWMRGACNVEFDKKQPQKSNRETTVKDELWWLTKKINKKMQFIIRKTGSDKKIYGEK